MKSIKSYGSKINTLRSSFEEHSEELKLKGYTVIPDVLSEDFLKKARKSIDRQCSIQENEFGLDEIEKIQEKNMLRVPLKFDSIFADLIKQEEVLNLVRSELGSQILLHLQNAIINVPNLTHHQTSWHRDLPYQNFTSSEAIAVSVLYCIDEFSPTTGSTIFLPSSHLFESSPSANYLEKNSIQLTAEAGSVVVFNSMVFHRAGYNSSQIKRRAINNVFVRPILKQQIDLPNFLDGLYSDDPELYTILGYKYPNFNSVEEFRNNRLKRTGQNE